MSYLSLPNKLGAVFRKPVYRGWTGFTAPTTFGGVGSELSSRALVGTVRPVGPSENRLGRLLIVEYTSFVKATIGGDRSWTRTVVPTERLGRWINRHVVGLCELLLVPVNVRRRWWKCLCVAVGNQSLEIGNGGRSRCGWPDCDGKRK